jgi:hypothetical protein
MRGQLWQECSCGTEPVCCDCERCSKHCRCASRQQRRAHVLEVEQVPPGLLDKVVEHQEQGSMEH